MLLKRRRPNCSERQLEGVNVGATKPRSAVDQHFRTRLASVGRMSRLEQPTARSEEVDLVSVGLFLIADVAHELAIAPPIRATTALGNAMVDMHAPLR